MLSESLNTLVAVAQKAREMYLHLKSSLVATHTNVFSE